MAYIRIVVIVVAVFSALSARGQDIFCRLDSLIGNRQYATAYPLAQEQYRQALQKGGSNLLSSAFYLTALDYAYSKSPEDSALARYSRLTRSLRGADRAVAYAFLYQTYRKLYERFSYRMRHGNEPSDDPARNPRLWHWQRMEDTLKVCVDSVLAQAEALRTADARNYSWIGVGENGAPVADSSLLGTLVQALLSPCHAFSDSLEQSLHRRVSALYADGSDEMRLWLDLNRLEGNCHDSVLAALDSLKQHYMPRLQSLEMKAWMNYRRALCLSYAERKVEAERLCLEVERTYAGTCGARWCRELRREICAPGFKVSYDVTESSRRSRLAMVEGRNMRWVDFRLVPRDSVPDSLRRANRLDTLRTLPATKEWRQELPDAADHLTHRHLVALPPVPQGDYYLVAMTDSLFCYNDYQSVDAVFIAYNFDRAAGKMTRLQPSSGYLVDRMTGQPLAGRRVTLQLEGTLTDRDYTRRRRTDKEGYFHFPVSSSRYMLQVANGLSADVDGYEYEYGDDQYYRDVRSNVVDKSDSKHLEIVMTDRPIYRLGDTVRFSCVAYKEKNSGEAWEKRLKPASKVRLLATFRDTDYEAKDTLFLTTDKHGRCWGEFVIPPDGKNGTYTLRVVEPDYESSLWETYNGYCGVEVEAYKAPRFAVTLSTTAEGAADTGSARRFGQPITVYGAAMSFSGAPMTGAKVKWEVSCERMVDPWQSTSIANDFPYADSLVVDDDGLFQFTFTPQRDDIAAGTPALRTYIYTAYVRVIDADGELHEQRLAFHVSDADGYCVVTTDDLSHLTFVYNNFDHQPLKGDVHVELYQLRQPDTLRVLHRLMREHPDARWVGSRAAFREAFPHLAFSPEEGDRHLWPVVAKRYEGTTGERRVDIDGLPSGLYRVSISTPDGERHDTLINHVARGGRVTGNDVVWLRSTPDRGNPYAAVSVRVGDTVRFELGSPFGEQPLYYCVSHAAKVYRRGMMVLDSSRATEFVIPVTSDMKDGFVVNLTAVRDGRTFNYQYKAFVVRPDLRLTVDIETFRDRLQPGEQERWHLRIASGDTLSGQALKTPQSSGQLPLPRGAGVEANLCLTMYDKALDELRDHHYGFWPWFFESQDVRVYEMGTRTGTMTGRGNLPPSSSQLIASMNRPMFGLALPSSDDYCRQVALRFYPGVIRGTIVDAQTGEVLPFVNVVLKRNGRSVTGSTTDLDGNFVMREIPAGEYELEVITVGYKRLNQRVTIGAGIGQRWNIALSSTATRLECVEIVADKVPVIEIGTPESGTRLSADDIARMPGNNVGEIVAAVGGMGYSDARGEVTMQGNVRKRTGVNVPKDAIAEIQPLLQFDGRAGEAPALRKNLSAVALFEPALRSDKEGRVEVSFTMPDGLTQWQLHGFAWTDDFQVGVLDRTLYTQKDLMVQPLMPRFLRQGDTTEIRAKVSNLTDSAMNVVVELEVESVKRKAESHVAAHSSSVVSFRIPVENDWHMADYKITATQSVSHSATRRHTDGEQGRLPVLSNRERVTTSRLLYIAGTTDPARPRTASYSFSFSPFDSVSVAFNASPMDYAVQALPQFKRHRMPGNLYMANSIYVNHLSSTLLPLSDKERKRKVEQVRDDLRNLLQEQTSQGGWSWMPGGKETSLHITAAILERLARCTSLMSIDYYKRYWKTAVAALDKEVVRGYQQSTANPQLSTLFARSFFLDMFPIAECDSITREAYDYYYRRCRVQSEQELSLMSQGQLALLMLRMGDTAEAVAMANRIKEMAHTDEQQGMYWVKNVGGYGWYQRPVETASLLVDVFADVLKDWQSVNRIQQWLLSAKQGTTWKTDMATASAVAALLRQPADTVRSLPATLTVNGKSHEEFKQSHAGEDAGAPKEPATLSFQLENPSPYPAWGAVFCSRELPLDSIRYDGTAISLRKTLSLVAADGSLRLLGPDAVLHVGDRVRVHIDIYCERDMDNMVLVDQRAAAFEPVSTASGWQWNDGLRYYVDVRDESHNCYIDRLNEGRYYVEYDLWVRHAGTFEGGIGVLRSVYAPEFRANTPSAKLHVAD
ncbi:MAG: alpha-2-macroglobulin family protein [Bacteroidales bacterium]|nr:alpha-2-macroglobulin family protein [Bacteroidales bacterium]